MKPSANSPDFLRAEREAFYAGFRTESLPITVNDSVRVKSGKFKGLAGAPISLESIDPEPTYLIELAPPGGDEILPLSLLERVNL
jgi:hypothetical protein